MSALCNVKLEDVVGSKSRMSDIEARTTCEDALRLMDKHKILSVPVWGQPGAWVGAGGEELVIGDKQYIGFVSVVDVLTYVLRKASKSVPSVQTAQMLSDLDEKLLPGALASPVFEALGATNESLSFWTETLNQDLLTTMEELCKGVHRVLVLPPTAGAPLQSWTEEFAEKARILTQTDVMKYVLENHRQGLYPSTHPFGKLLNTQVKDLYLAATKEGEVNKQLATVDAKQNLVLALYQMVDSRVHAVAVVDQVSKKLLSTLSMSNFRGMLAARLGAMHNFTVEEFLKSHSKSDAGTLPTPLTCDPEETLMDVIESLITCHVHRTWVVDSNYVPVDVITYTDVIKILYNAEKQTEGVKIYRS